MFGFEGTEEIKDFFGRIFDSPQSEKENFKGFQFTEDLFLCLNKQKLYKSAKNLKKIQIFRKNIQKFVFFLEKMCYNNCINR